MRPVSNLKFVSDITERAVFDQLYAHVMNNKLFPELQSAYRKSHSTETALVKIVNDILLDMNRQHVSLLVLLDLGASFGTVDHTILLRRLETSFGVTGDALKWIASYPSARSQRVMINGVLSNILFVIWSSSRVIPWTTSVFCLREQAVPGYQEPFA